MVRSFSQVLTLRRRDKGKPAVRRGRNAYGPPSWEVAGLSNGSGGATKLRPSERGEGADATLFQTQPMRLVLHLSSELFCGRAGHRRRCSWTQRKS